MSRIPRLSAEQRADLVAYLDGELGDEEARSIEQTLGGSEVARHEVEMLGRTWELLDTLPVASASTEFAAKTLASIRVEKVPVSVDWRPYARRGLIGLGWVTCLAAVAVIGFAAGRNWIPQADDVYVRELPMLERLDAYRDVGSLEMLHELQAQNLPLRRGASR
jgi:anti-sigma factor RsiW